VQLLAGAEGRVLEREEIYQRVWGYTMAHGDRSVDVFVRKVRAKLQRASPRWSYIHTHFGVGYRFAAEPAPAVEDARPGAAAAPAVVEPEAVAAPAGVVTPAPAPARVGKPSAGAAQRRSPAFA
jgi:two-component system response regulator RegX3